MKGRAMLGVDCSSFRGGESLWLAKDYNDRVEKEERRRSARRG
jgi:hypothetical protein